VTQAQPAPEFDSGAGTFSGSWAKTSAMPYGVIPCDVNSSHHFNIWFKPNETITAGSKIWFAWYIPSTQAPSVISDTVAVNSTLPSVP